jgi:hypothetical protein
MTYSTGLEKVNGVSLRDFWQDGADVKLGTEGISRL